MESYITYTLLQNCAGALLGRFLVPSSQFLGRREKTDFTHCLSRIGISSNHIRTVFYFHTLFIFWSYNQTHLSCKNPQQMEKFHWCLFQSLCLLSFRYYNQKRLINLLKSLRKKKKQKLKRRREKRHQDQLNK